jgi:hypothetical protein
MDNIKIVPVLSVYKDDIILEDMPHIISICTEDDWVIIDKKYTVSNNVIGVDNIVTDEIINDIKFHISLHKSIIKHLHYFYQNDLNNWAFNICSDTTTLTSLGFETETECKEFDAYLKSIL